MKAKLFIGSIALAMVLTGCGSSSKAPSCDDSDVTSVVTQLLTENARSKGLEIGKFTYKDFMTQDSVIPNPRKVQCVAYFSGKAGNKEYKDEMVVYHAQYTDDGDNVYVGIDN